MAIELKCQKSLQLFRRNIIDLADFAPYEVKPGQIFVFDGANLSHGNKLNDTQVCRISVDFRVVDFEKFKPSEKGSINLNTPFDIGGYFDVV